MVLHISYFISFYVVLYIVQCNRDKENVAENLMRSFLKRKDRDIEKDRKLSTMQIMP